MDTASTSRAFFGRKQGKFEKLMTQQDRIASLQSPQIRARPASQKFKQLLNTIRDNAEVTIQYIQFWCRAF